MVFDEASSCTEEERSGERAPIHERDGVHAIDARTRKSAGRADEAVSERGEEVFSGPGADLI